MVKLLINIPNTTYRDIISELSQNEREQIMTYQTLKECIKQGTLLPDNYCVNKVLQV